MRRKGTSLATFTSMPKLPKTSRHDSNVLILDERNYSREELLETLERDIQKMTRAKENI